MTSARLAVDIGGTFTDFALATGGRTFSRKVLTTARHLKRGYSPASTRSSPTRRSNLPISA